MLVSAKESTPVFRETRRKSLKSEREGKKSVVSRKRGDCSPATNNSLWLIFVETHLIIVSKW